MDLEREFICAQLGLFLRAMSAENSRLDSELLLYHAQAGISEGESIHVNTEEGTENSSVENNEYNINDTDEADDTDAADDTDNTDIDDTDIDDANINDTDIHDADINNTEINNTGSHQHAFVLETERRFEYSDEDVWVSLPPTEQQLTSRLKSLTVPNLKAICNCIAESKTGTKGILIDRIAARLVKLYAAKEFATYNQVVITANRLFKEQSRCYSTFPRILTELPDPTQQAKLLALSRASETKVSLPVPLVVERVLTQPILWKYSRSKVWPLKLEFVLEENWSLGGERQVVLAIFELAHNREFGPAAPAVADKPRIARYFSHKINSAPSMVGTTSANNLRYITHSCTTGKNTITLRFVPQDPPRNVFYLQTFLISSNLFRWIENSLGSMEVKTASQIIAEQQSKSIHEADTNISVSHLTISLRCPLSLAILTKPVRSRLCTHLQCFDLSVWWRLNEKTCGSGNCPVCNKEIALQDLFIDGFTISILEQVDGNVDEVSIDLADYSWNVLEPPISKNTRSEIASQTNSPHSKKGSGRRIYIDLTECNDDDMGTWIDPPIKPDPLIHHPTMLQIPVKRRARPPDPIIIEEEDVYTLDMQFHDYDQEGLINNHYDHIRNFPQFDRISEVYFTTDNHGTIMRASSNNGRLHSFFRPAATALEQQQTPGASAASAIVID